jgi:hypothetical protein
MSEKLLSSVVIVDDSEDHRLAWGFGEALGYLFPRSLRWRALR